MAKSPAGAKAPAFPWLGDPLAYLIGPHDPADFFARIYEREALILSRDDSKRYAPLLSIDALDRLISGVDLHEGQLDLANAINPIQRTAYVGAGGLIDRGLVARQYQGGSTVILQQLHQYDPTLADFCRALEHVFSCHVQTNVYLTPPNAQGFRTHYDNHDVFVIQVEGEKAWRLYDMPVEAPYRGEGFETQKHPVGELRQEFVLKAGECAYVPRGLMHDAATSGAGASLHITVGLIVRTWADAVIEAVSEVALKEPAFRRALPAGYARREFDREPARAYFRELIEALPKHAVMDNALDLIADQFIRSRIANTRGAIVEGSLAVEPSDRFRARPNTPWRLAEDGEKLVLIAPGGDVDFTPADAPALERALSGAEFTLADLNGADAEMVRKLQAFGLVQRI